MAQVTEEEAPTQDGHPNRDPGPDTPEPGRSGKTQAGKGDIGGRIDLAPDMAWCPCLTRQPTIEEIGEGDTHIQQEKAQPPMLWSGTMRLHEEKKKQRNTRQPRQGESARCREVKGTQTQLALCLAIMNLSSSYPLSLLGEGLG